MNRISLVAFPLLIMMLAGIISGVNFSEKKTTDTGITDIQPIALPNLLALTLIVSIALSSTILIGIKVFGSGVSGSVAPIVFLCIILMGIFGLFSALSFQTITQIPIIGIPLFFGLIACFCIGIAGLSVSSGGD